jgi:hypothetical protein
VTTVRVTLTYDVEVDSPADVIEEVLRIEVVRDAAFVTSEPGVWVAEPQLVEYSSEVL